MHDAVDIGPHAINSGVHGDFGGALAAPLDLIPLHIADDQVVCAHHPLANRGRSAKDPAIVHADADVPVVSRNPALVEDQSPDLDDVPPQLG